MLAAGLDLTGEVQTFDLRTNKPVATMKGRSRRMPGIAFHPENGTLATIGHDSFLQFWNPATGQQVGRPQQHQGQPQIVSFSPDGSLCATAQPDQVVRIFQLPSSSQQVDVELGLTLPGTPTHEPTVDRSGNWVVTPGARWGPAPQKLWIYEASTGQSRQGIFLDSELTASAISPSGDIVVALTAEPGTAAIDQNRNLDAYCNRPGRVAMWDCPSGTLRGDPIVMESLPIDAAFSPDERILAVVCADGSILRVNVETRQILGSNVHPGRINYGFMRKKPMLRFSNQGDRFVTMGFGKTVCIWKLDGELIAELSHGDTVREVNFSHGGELVVTACNDGSVRLWNAHDGVAVGKPLHHPDTVISATFHPQDERVVTACNDGTARIWDWRRGALAGPVLKHSVPVHSAVYSEDGTIVITAASREMRFWNPADGKELAPPRFLNAEEPFLVLRKGGRMAVVTGFPGTDRQTMVETISLEEIEPLNDSVPRGERLQTSAEILSARRAERGTSANLTSLEWLERWASRPPLSIADSRDQKDPEWAPRQQVATALREQRWDDAIAHMQKLLPEHCARPDYADAYRQAAESWYAKGDADQGHTHDRKALQLDPHLATALANQGRFWTGNGRYLDARRHFADAIRLAPNEPRAYAGRGRLSFVQNRYDEAIASFDEAIRLDPNYADAYFGRGAAWYERKNLEKAIADFDESLRLDPNKAVVVNYRGISWRDKGNIDKAVADFELAMRIDPRFFAPYRNRAWIRHKRGQYAEAIADFGEALALDPKYSDAYHGRAESRRQLGDYDTAISDYDKALRLNPKYAPSYGGRGAAWYSKKEFGKAIADYSEAIRLAPSTLYYYRRGSAWKNEGEHDKAIVDFDEALRLNPNYYLAFTGRGGSWHSKKDYDRAIADFDQGLRLKPDYAWAYAHRGVSWHAKEEYTRAIADFDEALRLNPDYHWAACHRSDTWRDKGNIEAALTSYTEALRLDATCVSANRNVAWIWATCPDELFRNSQRAIEHATRACESTNWKNAACLDVLAAACSEAGDFTKAIEWAEKAIAIGLPGKDEEFRARLELYKSGKPYRQLSPNSAAPTADAPSSEK